jgi:uncharacterized membrane protein
MEIPIPKPWELHPMLVHFPIAFLLGGGALLLWARWRPSDLQQRAAAGMLLAGMIFGWLAAAAGGLAYFTVPAHTEEGHVLMYWHLGFGLAMLALFTWVSITRWRGRATAATKPQLIAAFLGLVLLMLTGYVGGSIVYHHGAGVDPKILAPEIREGHSHQDQKGHEASDHEHTEH